MNLHKQWQSWIADLGESHTSADAVALGGGLGTFIAIFPTPGFNVLLAMLALAAFPTMNKVALFGALAFWNPIVCAPLYALAYEIGDMLFGSAVVVKFQVLILDHLYNFTRRFLAGVSIIAAICSLVVYAGLWSGVTWRQHRH